LGFIAFSPTYELLEMGGAPACRAEHWSFWREQPEGVRQGCRTLTKGQEAPFVNPRRKLRRAGYKRHPGVFSFGYFSLDKHKFAWSEFE